MPVSEAKSSLGRACTASRAAGSCTAGLGIARGGCGGRRGQSICCTGYASSSYSNLDCHCCHCCRILRVLPAALGSGRVTLPPCPASLHLLSLRHGHCGEGPGGQGVGAAGPPDGLFGQHHQHHGLAHPVLGRRQPHPQQPHGHCQQRYQLRCPEEQPQCACKPCVPSHAGVTGVLLSRAAHSLRSVHSPVALGVWLSPT